MLLFDARILCNKLVPDLPTPTIKIGFCSVTFYTLTCAEVGIRRLVSYIICHVDTPSNYDSRHAYSYAI